jgi:hypothetical protein
MEKRNLLISVGAVLVIGAAIWFSFSAGTQTAKTDPDILVPPTQGWECNQDAKICSDGSSVGRTGPDCHFAACPSSDATSATLTTYIDGQATGLNLTVNPRKVISDSRCPLNVQCIWAGTVEVRTVISTQVAHGEHTLKLGEPQVFGDFLVTLITVTPAPNAGEKIPEGSYRFVFEVRKL